MVTLEDLHQLLWKADDRFSTDVGTCTCSWRIWSPHKDEIREGHAHHLDFVRRRQEQAEKNLWELEVKQHTIRWNEPRDGAACNKCGWACFNTSTAAIYVSWNAHLEGLKTHAG